LVTGALSSDGTSRALGADARWAPDRDLLHRLCAAGELKPAVVASVDLFYGADEHSLLEAGAQALDMECATLFALARKLDLSAAAVLIVSDTLLPHRTRIPDDALKQAERAAGAIAAKALSETSEVVVWGGFLAPRRALGAHNGS
jgi:purine-nucleoside phosphorylase